MQPQEALAARSLSRQLTLAEIYGSQFDRGSQHSPAFSVDADGPQSDLHQFECTICGFASARCNELYLVFAGRMDRFYALTDVINVFTGSSGGLLTVTANNICGASTPPFTSNITLLTTTMQPGPINGPTAVCAGATVTSPASTLYRVHRATNGRFRSGWSRQQHHQHHHRSGRFGRRDDQRQHDQFLEIRWRKA